jgi:(R,R)-butanediol dehydrogenase/meso-butanediol dehydrogenase/diacetyl reductase
MQAAYYERNKTIRVGECSIAPPGPREVRIKVAWCGVCGTDLHIFLGHMDQRVATRQIMGHEAAGTVVETGADAGEWKQGDRVVARPLDPCGDCPACHAGHSHICHNLKFLGIDTPGAFQGSWTVPAHTLHRLPDKVDFELGAMIEPLAVACHDVRLAEVVQDEFVVVIGGGPIGQLVALVARDRGARVLVSEPNEYRVEFARQLGVDAVNPSEVDLPTYVDDETGGAGADVVFEVSGSAAGAEVMTRLPRTRGRIMVVGIHSAAPKVDLFRFFWRELRLFGARVYEPEDFERAIELVARGGFPLERLITDRCGLPELGDAFARIESGAEGMKTLINAG